MRLAAGACTAYKSNFSCPQVQGNAAASTRASAPEKLPVEGVAEEVERELPSPPPKLHVSLGDWMRPEQRVKGPGACACVGTCLCYLIFTVQLQHSGFCDAVHFQCAIQRVVAG